MANTIALFSAGRSITFEVHVKIRGSADHIPEAVKQIMMYLTVVEGMVAARTQDINPTSNAPVTWNRLSEKRSAEYAIMLQKNAAMAYILVKLSY